MEIPSRFPMGEVYDESFMGATEYPAIGHNAWDAAYADPGLVEWLLAHRLR